MTANDKAATYLGWNPNRCDGMCKGWWDGSWVCDLCGQDGHGWSTPANGPDHSHLRIEHKPAKAPDMSKPENYMRALETLNSGDIPGPSIEGGEGTWEVTFYLGHTIENSDGSLSARLIRVEESTFSDAIVKALAALWDAEHEESKP